MDNKNLENVLRRCSIEKLDALKVISGHEKKILDTTTISSSLSKDGQNLGGLISSIARTKIDGKPLLIASGKSKDGILWRLNEEVAPKGVVHALVSEILKETEEYRSELKS